MLYPYSMAVIAPCEQTSVHRWLQGQDARGARHAQLRTHSDTHMAVKHRCSQAFHALGQRSAEQAHRLQQCARR